jgi:hypothetical protein
MNIADYINKCAISPGLRAKVFDRKLVRLYQKSFRAKDPSTKIDIKTKIRDIGKDLDNALNEVRRLELSSLKGYPKSSTPILDREFISQLGQVKPRYRSQLAYHHG